MSITYGMNELTTITSTDINSNMMFTCQGTTIVSPSAELVLNYSVAPTYPILVNYTITAIRLS